MDSARPALLTLIFFGAFIVACGEQNAFPQPAVPDNAGLQAALARTVTLYYKTGRQPRGSGVLLNEDGLILTCRHVVNLADDNLRVSRDGDEFFEAHIVFSEARLDLALLKIAGNTRLRGFFSGRLAPLEWASRSELLAGERIYLFGAPWGLVNSYLEGTIAHNDRSGIDATMPDVPLIQTNGVSYPGASGAAVYRADGKLIGLNRATFGYVAGTGVGLTIPAEIIREFLEANGAAIQSL